MTKKEIIDMVNLPTLMFEEYFSWASWLKTIEIILFRQTKLLDFYWRLRNWDFHKERTRISINQAYLISFNTTMDFYCLWGSSFKLITMCYWFWSAKAKIIWARENIYHAPQNGNLQWSLLCGGIQKTCKKGK